MSQNLEFSPKSLARRSGWALAATLIIGIAASMTVAKGIDINLSADVAATAENMLDAETRLRAKGYIGALVFALNIFVSAGFYLLLRRSGPALSLTSLVIGVGASLLVLLGAVFAMNAAQIASNSAYSAMGAEAQQLALLKLQATSDYTSFHLGLILSTLSSLGFFVLFFKQNSIPRWISGWGIFASLFVVSVIVARDFIPALGHDLLTMGFMLSNLISIILLAGYLSIWGVRDA